MGTDNLFADYLVKKPLGDRETPIDQAKPIGDEARPIQEDSTIKGNDGEDLVA